MNEQHNNDRRDGSLSHSWGKKPEQKAREKEYNAWYYKEHKREILNKQKERRKNQKKEEKNVWGNILGKTVYEDGPRGRKVAINKKVTPKHRNPDEYYSLVEQYKTKSKKKLDKKNSAVQDINNFKKVLKKSGYEVRSDNEAKILWKEFRKDLGYKDEMFVMETKNTQKKMKVKKPGLISRGKNLVSNLFHEDKEMNEYYGNNDWRDYSLAHGWGHKPEQKAREKQYNAWYYKTHKDEILKKRKGSHVDSEYEKEKEYNSRTNSNASSSSSSSKTDIGKETPEDVEKLYKEGKVSKEYYEEYMSNTGNYDKLDSSKEQRVSTETTPEDVEKLYKEGKVSKEYYEEYMSNTKKNTYELEQVPKQQTKSSSKNDGPYIFTVDENNNTVRMTLDEYNAREKKKKEEKSILGKAKKAASSAGSSIKNTVKSVKRKVLKHSDIYSENDWRNYI